MFAVGDACSPEVTLAAGTWLQTDVSTSLVCLRPASSDTVLVKKMFSLHCLGRNIQSYTCGVYLCIPKDTSAFFLLQISPSTTHHETVNQGEFHMCMCWCRVVVFCVIPSLTISIFHCSLLDLYLWVHLFPRVGPTMATIAWLAVFASGFPVNCSGPVLQKPLVCQFRQACLPPAFQTEVRWEAKSTSVCRSRRELAPPELSRH